MLVNDIPWDKDSVEKYYPSPSLKQNHSRAITATNEYLVNSNLNKLSTLDVIYSMLNRMTTVTYDFTLYTGLVKNLLDEIDKKNVTKLTLRFSNYNKVLARYIRNAVLSDFPNLDVEIVLENRDAILFSCSKQAFLSQLKISMVYVIKFFTLMTLSLFSLFFFYFAKIFCIKNTDKVLWMSFANNREKVDYPLLSMLQKRGIKLCHIETAKLKKITPQTEILYFSSRYGVNLECFIALLKSMFCFYTAQKRMFNEIESNTGLTIPNSFTWFWQGKIYLHLFNTILLFHAVKRIQKEQQIKVVYRGGNADSIFLVSLLDNNKTILLPHGTEFYPIDHNTINYIDMNLLPSENICKLWSNDLYQDSNVELKGVGRPYYATLKNMVIRRKNSESKVVGIVLTYGSNDDAVRYVDHVISGILKEVATEHITFLIKQRPNLSHDLSKSEFLEHFTIFDKDIYSFLGCIDMVVVGLSPFGVVGMVGTDSIYCEIPTLFYFGDHSFSSQDLGYSWCEALNDVAYWTKSELSQFFSNRTFDESMVAALEKQHRAKLMLGDSTNTSENLYLVLKHE